MDQQSKKCQSETSWLLTLLAAPRFTTLTYLILIYTHSDAFLNCSSKMLLLFEEGQQQKTNVLVVLAWPPSPTPAETI